jgi:hypothetical protein
MHSPAEEAANAAHNRAIIAISIENGPSKKCETSTTIVYLYCHPPGVVPGATRPDNPRVVSRSASRVDPRCINKVTADLPDGDAFDFDINLEPRIVGPAPDMGADEYTRNFTFTRDRDHEDYGNPKISVQADTQPGGYLSDNTDCNDRKASVHPGALELCNHRDGRIDKACHCKSRLRHMSHKHHTVKNYRWSPSR